MTVDRIFRVLHNKRWVRGSFEADDRVLCHRGCLRLAMDFLGNHLVYSTFQHLHRRCPPRPADLYEKRMKREKLSVVPVLTRVWFFCVTLSSGLWLSVCRDHFAGFFVGIVVGVVVVTV